MRGIVIRQPWIDYIFEGKKTWEIRGRNTNIRERIALIQSQTGLIVGTVELIDSKLLSLSEYQASIQFHCIEDCSVAPYEKTHAWFLKNAVRFQKPIPYKHPQGAVIWVSLDEYEEVILQRTA
jgi:hypothetical protein